MQKQSKSPAKTNGEKLRALVEKSGLTQAKALELINTGQMRPVSLSTLKAYLSAPDGTRYRACPDNILERAKEVLAPSKK